MMIKILELTYRENGKFLVEFSDGSQGVIDMKSYISSRSGALLDRLQDEGFMRSAFVDAGAMAWPNGLEISPEKIFELTEKVKMAA